jgi:hypothetical protein
MPRQTEYDMQSAKNPLRRNQKRIDEIGRLFKGNRLLVDEDIHKLAHDFGDLEDAAIRFPEVLDRIAELLRSLQSAPKECFEEVNGLRGWFDEFRGHMQSAEPLIERICDEIIRRNPSQFPWADSEAPEDVAG